MLARLRNELPIDTLAKNVKQTEFSYASVGVMPTKRGIKSWSMQITGFD